MLLKNTAKSRNATYLKSNGSLTYSPKHTDVSTVLTKCLKSSLMTAGLGLMVTTTEVMICAGFYLHLYNYIITPQSLIITKLKSGLTVWMGGDGTGLEKRVWNEEVMQPLCCSPTTGGREVKLNWCSLKLYLTTLKHLRKYPFYFYNNIYPASITHLSHTM